VRVLTFTTLFPNRREPNRGVFIRRRMERVAALCDIEVIAPVPFPGRGVPRRETIAGLAVHHPRYWSLPGRWPAFKPRSMASSARSLAARLHAEQPFDLVDAHFAHPDGAAAARLAEKLGLPLVLSLRGSDIHRDLHDPALRPRILDTVRRAAAVIAVAAPLADALRDAGADMDKVHVIENGIDADAFPPRDAADAKREIGASDSDTPLLFAAGSLLPIKGFDILLEAFARANLQARLWIAGEGAQRPELEALVKRHALSDRVRLLGTVAAEAMPAYFAAADGFVLSSRNEGCPNVLLEALASGCPVVATRVGHVPALVTDGENGTLVPAEDVTAMAHALTGLLDKKTHDRARIRASVDAHTWERVARRVREVFQDTLRGPGNPVNERTSAPCSAES